MLLLSLLAAALAGEPYIKDSPTELLDSVWTGSDRVVTMRGNARMRELSKQLLSEHASLSGGGPLTFDYMLAFADVLYEEALDCREPSDCAQAWAAAYDAYIRCLKLDSAGTEASYPFEMALRCLWHGGQRGRPKMDELATALPDVPRTEPILLIQADVAAQRGDSAAAEALFSSVWNRGGAWAFYAMYRRAWSRIDAGDIPGGIRMLEERTQGIKNLRPLQFMVVHAAERDLMVLYNTPRVPAR